MSTEIRRFVADDGVELLAEMVGRPEMGSVILAHGGGQTRHSWRATARSLAQTGWRAVAVDLRGHGDSGWSADGDYRIERFARDLIDVAHELGDRPSLIGASLGGLAGLCAEAVIAPGTFNSLTLVDIIPKMDPAGVSKIMGFMGANLEQGFASLDEASECIASYLPHRPKRQDLSGLAKNLRLGADGRYRWHWDPRFVTGGRAPSQLMSDFDARCESIAIPVHLVRGRISELVAEDEARAFVARMRYGRFSDLAGAGHMVAGDNNDAFLAAVTGFLANLAQEAGHD
ncbi:MAG: alpha/beta hydrolase [Phenylobacterium sp.]|uniref:alpha/beta fold hydrolase n=1 Tax=Phenylobacterium sp. TaxID=1871053 RepID=UPI001B4E8565|nr:alpha/beta hydrolase [Phenylobacterium sp.]MBP7817821.1 alpha/beta hydrolase [Phenylobacterium sp.]